MKIGRRAFTEQLWKSCKLIFLSNPSPHFPPMTSPLKRYLLIPLRVTPNIIIKPPKPFCFVNRTSSRSVQTLQSPLSLHATTKPGEIISQAWKRLKQRQQFFLTFRRHSPFENGSNDDGDNWDIRYQVLVKFEKG